MACQIEINRMEFLSGKEPINLTGMSREDFDRYERVSREVLVNTMEKRDLAAHGLRLCDITVSFPDLRIASAKKILSYIQSVEEHQFGAKSTDPQTEALLRQALELPNDQKDVLGLIRNLGIGPYWARQLVTILQTFQGAGFESQAVAVRSIVSQGYGEYSPFEERGQRRGRQEPERERVRERPEERRREPPPQRRPRDEEPEEEEEPRPRRYSREVEAFRERPEKREKEPSRREKEREPKEEAPSDLVGRRCLFHGGVAVTRCSKCKAILCRECIRGSDRCPRCNTPLKDVEETHDRKRTREEEPEEETEEEEVRPRRREKEELKAPKKKKEEEDDLSRL